MNKPAVSPIHIEAGTLVIVSGSQYQYRSYTAGSVEAYTAANSLKWTTVDAEVERAKKNGHDLAWLGQNSTTICGDPGFYEREKAKLDAALRLNLGDVVEMEGRTYQLIATPNNNIGLKPVEVSQ